jgi:hypothetical protein
MHDGCLCACVAVQATMVNAHSGNAMRKVVRGLLALTLMMINVQTGGIKGERKKLPRTLSDTPYPKAQRRCVRTYAEDTKTGNGAAAADDFCVVPLCIELCPFAETDDSPPTHHNPHANVVYETLERVDEPTLIPSRLKEQEPHDAGTPQQVIDNTTVTATEEEEAAREQEEEDEESTWGPEQDKFIADIRELLLGPDSDEDNEDTNPNAPRINSNDDTGTDAEDDEVTVPIFNDSEINTFRYNLRPSKYGLRRSMTVEQVADACVALEAHDDIDGCWRLLEKVSPDKGEQCEALFAAYRRHWAKEEATSHFKR